MLQLISKLQHNTYEKGEYSDEQPRDLDETIQLIKDFPWDAERALTDIQLTGPSVTIEDNDRNSLKLGLYFSGKFCLYYLDHCDHLYEYHAPTIDEACRLVDDFFNQQIDLKLFDRHLFNIGNKQHFITNSFIYRIKPFKVIGIAALISFFVLSSFYFRLLPDEASSRYPVGAVFGIVAALGLFIGVIVFALTMGKRQYLQISRGNSKFSYGYNEKRIVLYDKLDIKEISYYIGARGGMSHPKITFKNGSYIEPENLISVSTLLKKFPESLKITIKQYQQTSLGSTERIVSPN